MTSDRRKQLTQPELIIQLWRELDAESVGARELEAINSMLIQQLGSGAGPAAIARTLADEGVPLRHPEVLESDTLWRKRQLAGLLSLDHRDFITIKDALASAHTIVAAANGLEANGDSSAIESLRSLVRRIQQDLALIGKSPLGTAQMRAVAAEAAGWLTVWLQNPAIFENWLALRRNSPEFLQQFGE
jgi:hypothetical protein